ncbi:hypothetical protein SAMN04487974_103440 [Pelagibacterium luteolum]|uniref:YHS domain-containing protein n=2 Tax=Pelagibacterium luteolum TaxID=440168 RepID=A0A1G7V3R6_9HYPH|nr:hypothetical protein SAMN04487974_103440 [Pelagibacterium luteolum]
MRQRGKQILTLTKSYAVLFAIVFAAAMAPAHAQQKGYVTNVLTGVAISGYDPVAYFTEDAAIAGTPLYEYEWGGAAWYFSSAANRDVFIAAPEVYAPMFGGHCTTSMARGFLSDGNPQIFRIVADRLLLFHSVGNREAFDMSRAPQLATAIDNWDALPRFQSQANLAH